MTETRATYSVEDLPGLLAERISEKEFRQHVVDYARSRQWLVYYTWRSVHSPSGFPDLCMVRLTRTVFAELKTEKGRLTADQQKWLDALWLAGHTAHVWRPSDWAAIQETLA